MSVIVRDEMTTQTAVAPAAAPVAEAPTSPAPAATLPATAPASQELEFLSPPPGLRDLRRFTLEAIDDAGLLFSLRSTEDPAVRLFLVPPRAYFPDYIPRLDGSARDALGIQDDEAVLLVVVHPGRGDESPTANLLAPVVVDLVHGRALQVVLEEDWPLRAPLIAA
ncbi:flagellar assembly protein FliW [Actinotalea ferrariae]|uniref:flagellar assembly protein FliW n=1 Tax=Actinotalea ferrariae TaxID=1386098 RepID=UPI001C8B7916|nr:flagellar assembly protein FliW [Actinotalea ferrariae]MBX9246641.1 flagellar assembly protein FliW [Actinotalea ferrariae]